MIKYMTIVLYPFTPSQDCQMSFYECSACSGDNVVESMVHLARWAKLKVAAGQQTWNNKQLQSNDLLSHLLKLDTLWNGLSYI